LEYLADTALSTLSKYDDDDARIKGRELYLSKEKVRKSINYEMARASTETALKTRWETFRFQL